MAATSNCIDVGNSMGLGKGRVERDGREGGAAAGGNLIMCTGNNSAHMQHSQNVLRPLLLGVRMAAAATQRPFMAK